MKEKKARIEIIMYMVFVVALGLRILLACISRGFLTDLGCFYGWGTRVFREGFAAFYTQDSFSDYPPGYIYVLYLIGGFLTKCNISYLSPMCLLVLKLPSIVCDMLLGLTVYFLANDKWGEKKAAFLAAAYLFNPAVLLNSVFWGQVDAIFTLCVVWMCISFMKKKPIPAYVCYALGLLFKPQTLIFTPLLIFGICENLFEEKFEFRNFFYNLFSGLAVLAAMFLLWTPFGTERVWKLYTETLESYPYISVNAYNFWAMFGLNWSSQEKTILGKLQYHHVGTFIILLICLISALIFWKKRKQEERYFITGAFIIVTMFLFSVRMHERYLYPVMIFALLSYVVSGREKRFTVYVLMTIVHFLNVYHVLHHYDPHNYDSKATPILAISAGTVLAGACFYYSLIKKDQETTGEFDSLWGQGFFKYYFSPVEPKEVDRGLKRNQKDFLYILGVTGFYAIFAFYNLGSTKVPHSIYQATRNENIMLTIPEGEEVSKVVCYLGYETDVNLSAFEWNGDYNEWDYVQNVYFKNVYQWNEVNMDMPIQGYLCFVVNVDKYDLTEMVLFNKAGEAILPSNYQQYAGLFDEQELCPKELNYMYSTYFDEIYYTRTAHDMLNGYRTYEWTHPPFGKILISLGVLLFGETPFGFRFMGTLVGCLMLPFLYAMASNFLRSKESGLFVTFLFAFDFMHFTQTRLCTIDVYITFFVILMYYFMEKYTRHNFYKEPLKKTLLPLAGCGIAFGFGIASKWTGFFAGLGLCLIFFGVLLRRLRESIYLYIQAGVKEAYLRSEYGRKYLRKVITTGLFCMIFFVSVPFYIYTLSYIPFRNYDANMGLLERMVQNQKDMLSYHENVTQAHPYASRWYDWPIMKRPCLYEASDVDENTVRGISAFGNPLVFWAGIPIYIYMMYLWLKKRDFKALFLVVSYLMQYLPWMFIGRITFIYHYFPSVPFLCIMIGYAMVNIPFLQKDVKRKNIAMLLYAVAAFGLFILFYPVLSGAPVARDFVKETLQWLKTWVLVI